jgi:hypothetical protein
MRTNQVTKAIGICYAKHCSLAACKKDQAPSSTKSTIVDEPRRVKNSKRKARARLIT